MIKNPLVSIIIVNWNGKPHLINCLASLQKVHYKPLEIILVDNNSCDGSVDFVEKKYRSVRIIKNKKNVGFCLANNKGYKVSKGKYVLFLNNDTIVTSDFLKPLITTLEENSRNGIVQPKIVFWGNKKLQTGGAFITNTGFLYHYGYGKNPQDPKYNFNMQIYSANGSCMFVKREVINKIGLFDEDYFTYFEETDFCHRALLAGYKIWYQPKSIIYHIGNIDNSKHKNSFLVYISFRNRICTYLKNLETGNLIKIVSLHFLLCLFSVFVFLVLRKPDYSYAIIKALFYNIANIKSILKKRTKVQNQIRKLKDKEIFHIVSRNPKPYYYLYLFSGLERYND